MASGQKCFNELVLIISHRVHKDYVWGISEAYEQGQDGEWESLERWPHFLGLLSSMAQL